MGSWKAPALVPGFLWVGGRRRTTLNVNGVAVTTGRDPWRDGQRNGAREVSMTSRQFVEIPVLAEKRLVPPNCTP
jgi:hypothetical protein